MRAAALSRAARAVLVALGFAVTAFSIGVAFAEPLTLEVTQAAPSRDHLDPSRAILTIRLAESSRQAFANFSKAHVGQKIEVRIDGNSVSIDSGYIDPIKFLSSPGLWIGLVVAAALFAAAVWQRRYRTPI